MKIILPMPPNLTNGRMHHMVKHRIKVGYWALCDHLHGHGTDLDALRWLTRFAHTVGGSKELRRQCARTLEALGWRDMAPVRPPRVPYPVARLSSVMLLGAAMDDDNAMARHKWAADWLRTRGYIAEDRRSALQWAGLPEQRVQRGATPTLTLTLEPLEGVTDAAA